MPQSPASENNTAMGATAPGQGIKGENVSDASQRKGTSTVTFRALEHSCGMNTDAGDLEYFGGGTQEGHKNQAGDAISKVGCYTM